MKNKNTPTEIEEILQVSRRCINDTMKRLDESGEVFRRPGSGKKRITNRREDLRLIKIDRDHPEKSVNELVGDWGFGNRSTVSRRLIEASFWC